MTENSNDASLAKLLAAVEAIQAFASIHGVRDLVISRCDEDHAIMYFHVYAQRTGNWNAIQNPGFRHPLPHVLKNWYSVVQTGTL